MKKILIIDSIHHAFEEMLSPHGFEFTDGTELSQDELLEAVGSYHGIVVRSRLPINNVLLQRAERLEFIARAGAGMENIDTAGAAQKGITCINAPEANRDAVAEHALAMLLALFNRIPIADAEVRMGIWKREENRGVELKGKTVGIIGFGNTGSAFAKCLRGFDVTILAYDKYINIDMAEFPFVSQVQMHDIYNHADVVSLHLPLNEETAYMADANFFSGFAKRIYVINTSRGRVLHTAALADAIKTGMVMGACLDVIEYETSSFEKPEEQKIPEAWNFLVNSRQVVLSPHVAGWTVESHKKISEVMAEKILALYNVKH